MLVVRLPDRARIDLPTWFVLDLGFKRDYLPGVGMNGAPAAVSRCRVAWSCGRIAEKLPEFDETSQIVVMRLRGKRSTRSVCPPFEARVSAPETFEAIVEYSEHALREFVGIDSIGNWLMAIPVQCAALAIEP